MDTLGEAVLTEADWRVHYKPIINPLSAPNDFFEADNPEDEAFVAAQDPRFVWTEVMNWDLDRAVLLPEFYPSGGDVLYWHVCEVPWSDEEGRDEAPDVMVIMDYDEEDDEDD